MYLHYYSFIALKRESALSPLALRKVSSVTFFRLALLACSIGHSVLGQGDQLLARRGLDGQVDHAHCIRGPCTVLEPQLVRANSLLQILPDLSLVSFLISQMLLQCRLRTMRTEGEQLGRHRLTDLLALHVVHIELGDIVDVPLDVDFLIDVVGELRVRVECAELVDALVCDAGGCRLHQQHRCVLSGWSCLFIARAVLEQLDRRTTTPGWCSRMSP